jgi:hypothetical protein
MSRMPMGRGSGSAPGGRLGFVPRGGNETAGAPAPGSAAASVVAALLVMRLVSFIGSGG